MGSGFVRNFPRGNIAAALVVAEQNFGLEAIAYLMVTALIGLVILMPLAVQLGKRTRASKSIKADTREKLR